MFTTIPYPGAVTPRDHSYPRPVRGHFKFLYDRLNELNYHGEALLVDTTGSIDNESKIHAAIAV